LTVVPPDNRSTRPHPNRNGLPNCLQACSKPPSSSLGSTRLARNAGHGICRDERSPKRNRADAKKSRPPGRAGSFCRNRCVMLDVCVNATKGGTGGASMRSADGSSASRTGSFATDILTPVQAPSLGLCAPGLSLNLAHSNTAARRINCGGFYANAANATAILLVISPPTLNVLPPARLQWPAAGLAVGELSA
jgi:hypothetical protein